MYWKKKSIPGWGTLSRHERLHLLSVARVCAWRDWRTWLALGAFAFGSLIAIEILRGTEAKLALVVSLGLVLILVFAARSQHHFLHLMEERRNGPSERDR